MTVRVYSHETVTVPATYAYNGFQQLKDILIACLVSGAGGIPGAGWQLLADSGSDTGHFVIGNGAGDLFICFAYDQGGAAKVSISRTFSGVDASGSIVGECARSGNLPGFTAYQRLGIVYLGGYNSAGRAGWCLVADDAAFAVTISSSSGTYSGSSMDTGNQALVSPGLSFGAGRTSKGFGYVIGGSINTSAYNGLDLNCTYFENPSSGLLIPSAETTATAVLAVRPAMYGFSADTAEFLYEDLPSVEGHLHVGSLGDLGRIKGFLFLPTLQQGYYRHVLRRLGMAPNFATMTPRDIAAVIRGGDGHDYAYAKVSIGTSPANHATPCLVTNNPRVW